MREVFIRGLLHHADVRKDPVKTKHDDGYDRETGKRDNELAADGKPREYAIKVDQGVCLAAAEAVS